MMDTGQVNLDWAAALFAGLAGSGVTEVVASPGSRCTPLILACGGNEALNVRMFCDERSAAFFALGIARASGRPVACVATSGSAPANWYPAVIEASQDNVPLIMISADRPPELQDCGANQTIDQVRLFGDHVRTFVQLPEAGASEEMLQHAATLGARAVDRSRWPVPGPVHINVPLREPLVPQRLPPVAGPLRYGPVTVDYPGLVPNPAQAAALASRFAGRPGVIVCGRGASGAGFARSVTGLARRLGCPILADPLSGLRCGEHDRTAVLTHYDAFLRSDTFVSANRPDWVLRFGGVPTSKVLQGYLGAIADSAVTLVVPYGPWPDPTRQAGHIVHADPVHFCDELAGAVTQPAAPEWIEVFRSEEQRIAKLLEDTASLPLEGVVLQALAQQCQEGTSLFCGNSMVIRDVDSFFTGTSRDVRIFGNRGASGIDGNVSTVLGIAASAGPPVVGLLGDIALYHDMNGLLAARELNATLIVFNNGGGGIFSYLPQHELPDFERHWLTPTGLDPGEVASLYGLRHVVVQEPAAFEADLEASLSRPGVDLIEVKISREESVARHRSFWEAAAGQ